MNKDGELISKTKERANTFNDYSVSIVENLNLEHWDEGCNGHSVIKNKNDVNDFIKKCINHHRQRIYIYKSKINKFSLCLVATNEIKKTIVYLKTNRSLGRGVQMRILKESDF